jgi:hypothetical protein
LISKDKNNSIKGQDVKFREKIRWNREESTNEVKQSGMVNIPWMGKKKNLENVLSLMLVVKE